MAHVTAMQLAHQECLDAAQGKKWREVIPAASKAVTIADDRMSPEERKEHAKKIIEALAKRAEAYLELGRPEECLRDGLRLCTDFALNYEGYFVVGLLMKKEGQFERAREYFARGAQLTGSILCKTKTRGVISDLQIHAGEAPPVMKYAVPPADSFYRGELPTITRGLSTGGSVRGDSTSMSSPRPVAASPPAAESKEDASPLPAAPAAAATPAATPKAAAPAQPKHDTARMEDANSLYIAGGALLAAVLLASWVPRIVSVAIAVVAAHAAHKVEVRTCPGGTMRFFGVPLCVFTSAVLCYVLVAGGGADAVAAAPPP